MGFRETFTAHLDDGHLFLRALKETRFTTVEIFIRFLNRYWESLFGELD